MDEPQRTARTTTRRRRRRGRRRRGDGRAAPAVATVGAAEADVTTAGAPPAIEGPVPGIGVSAAAGRTPAPSADGQAVMLPAAARAGATAVLPGDARLRIRVAVLGFLSRHQETQVPTLLDALRQTIDRFGRAEEIMALEVLHELTTANIVLPGLDGTHLGWPWLRVTEYGRQVIRQGKPVPFDPDQYLAALQQRLPSIDPLLLELVRESVSTYHRGFVRSSALMLGTASEILILELIDGFLATRAAQERARLQELFADKSIYARYRIFREELEEAREDLTLPDPVSKDIDAIIDLIFNAVRLNRNEAGHPSGAPLNPVLVGTTLLAFLEYAERIARLVAHFREMPEKPARPRAKPRRRRTRRAARAKSP